MMKWWMKWMKHWVLLLLWNVNFEVFDESKLRTALQNVQAYRVHTIKNEWRWKILFWSILNTNNLFASEDLEYNIYGLLWCHFWAWQFCPHTLSLFRVKYCFILKMYLKKKKMFYMCVSDPSSDEGILVYSFLHLHHTLWNWPVQ